MKILMVCLGNICRSPMADGLMRKKIADHNLDVVIDSAGTGDWHIGHPPDSRMIETAKNNGVPIDELRGRQFKVEDFDVFDRIIVMDKSNSDNVRKVARDEKDVRKIEMFLDLTHPGKDLDVPDPYFGGDEGFQDVFDMLDAGTDVILKELKEIKKND